MQLPPLDIPRFPQAVVLRLIPLLKAKTLQNWASRGITSVGTQAPGKSGRRLYSIIEMIRLDFMVRVGLYGVPPVVAAEMAGMVEDEAREYLGGRPTLKVDENDGAPIIPRTQDSVRHLRQLRIYTYDGDEYFADVVCREAEKKSFEGLNFDQEKADFTDRLLYTTYINYELDQLVIELVNLVLAYDAGVLDA